MQASSGPIEPNVQRALRCELLVIAACVRARSKAQRLSVRCSSEPQRAHSPLYDAKVPPRSSNLMIIARRWTVDTTAPRLMPHLVGDTGCWRQGAAGLVSAIASVA